MKFLLAFLIATKLAVAEPHKVAIIDTGLDLSDPRFKHLLCKGRHIDLLGEGIEDNDGHGTHVAGLIKEYAGNSDYCLVIIKYFSKGKCNNLFTLGYYFAITQGADIINFSSYGENYNKTEDYYIRTNKNIKFVVAAGNRGDNLIEHKYYPASLIYPNLFVVGWLDKDGTPHKESNYGENITIWENGTNVLSTLPSGKEGFLSGSSMSAAIYTGKLIKKLYEKKQTFSH